MKRTAITLLLLSFAQAHAADSLLVTDGFRVKPDFGGRKIAATSVVGGMLVTSLLWSYDTWWRDSGRKLQFKSENWLNGTFKGIDKVGHFYTSYFYYHAFRNVMLWGGYEQSTAEWWAVGGAAFFALAVEVGDGITPQYGFDYQDLVFNFGGIAYGMLQSRIDVLKHFNFKWSYIPSGGYKFPLRFTDNYDAHTYWLTCNINHFLPETIEPYWPDFIHLAVGMGVDERWTKREFVVGLDFDLLSLLSPKNEDWLLVQRTVNMFHFPAPAIKFTEEKEPRYYLLHSN